MKLWQTAQQWTVCMMTRREADGRVSPLRHLMLPPGTSFMRNQSCSHSSWKLRHATRALPHTSPASSSGHGELCSLILPKSNFEKANLFLSVA